MIEPDIFVLSWLSSGATNTKGNVSPALDFNILLISDIKKKKVASAVLLM